MNRKRIVGLAILLASLVLLAACSPSSEEGVLFEDKVSFREFSDEKIEGFSLEEDTLVEFSFEGKIKSGEVDIRVYSSGGDIIHEISQLNYSDSFEKNLPAGDYHYLLKIDNGIKGKLHNKAIVLKDE